MKSQSYMTRAMRAQDPRFATILGKIGYQRADMAASAPAMRRKAAAATQASERAEDALPELRKQYLEVIGKRPFNGWNAETLQSKIAEARAAK